MQLSPFVSAFLLLEFLLLSPGVTAADADQEDRHDAMSVLPARDERTDPTADGNLRGGSADHRMLDDYLWGRSVRNVFCVRFFCRALFVFV